MKKPPETKAIGPVGAYKQYPGSSPIGRGQSLVVREALLPFTWLHFQGANTPLRHLEDDRATMLRLTGGHKRGQLRIGQAVLLEHAKQADQRGSTERHRQGALATGDRFVSAWEGLGKARKKESVCTRALGVLPHTQGTV